MPTPAKPAKQPARSVRISLPAEMLADIDKISEAELLSRPVWIRRTLNNAVRFQRWQSSLNKRP